jgi:hypothetical protein
VLGANEQKVDRVEGNWEDGMRIDIEVKRTTNSATRLKGEVRGGERAGKPTSFLTGLLPLGSHV